MIFITRRFDEQRVVDLWVILRFACAQDVRHAARRIQVRRKAHSKRFGPCHLRRVNVGDGQLLEMLAVFGNVHGAPVGQVRHRQLCDAAQRRFIIERRGERGAGFGQKARPLLAGFGGFARSLLGDHKPLLLGEKTFAFCFGALAFGDVAGDGRSACERARRAFDRRNRQGHVDPLAIFLHPHGFIMMNMFAAFELRENVVDIIVARRCQQANILADDFFGAIAVEPFSAGVPTEDRAVQLLADNRIVRRLDKRGQKGQGVFRLLALGHVYGDTGKANRRAVVVVEGATGSVNPAQPTVETYGSVIDIIQSVLGNSALNRLSHARAVVRVHPFIKGLQRRLLVGWQTEMRFGAHIPDQFSKRQIAVPEADAAGFESQVEALAALAQGVFGFAALGDVAEHQHGTEKFASIILDRRAAVINGCLRAVFPDQHRMVCQPDNDPFAQRPDNRAFDRLA